ncbi:LacI family DNA-binding transcriptional regulator [Paenibacillus sp. PL2-23]|uniref:LacI family DNA-binding transcriptional regulator n=1 Tax=Paenibacillus sp. PL2-23 TaxID=2100729 RepID=UPI0030FB171A
MGRRKAATLEDLSSELGISIQTISKALRGLPGMSEATRGRIIRTAYMRGYLSTSQAREMARQGIMPYPSIRLRFILVQSHESMNYNRLLTDGLEERFRQFDHQLERYVLDEDWSEETFQQWVEEHNIIHADGLLIAPRIRSSSIESRLLSLPLAITLINYPRPLSQVDSVVWDVQEAIYQSVDFLYRKGHRRILYVGDVLSQRGYVLRQQAFDGAMAELGLPVLHASAPGFMESYRQHAPTAVIVGIDEDCPAVYRALTEVGVSIPEQCSLVALVNEQPPELPLLSRPQLLIKETGYQAADRILWRLAHPNQPYEHSRIMGSFQEGATSSPV